MYTLQTNVRIDRGFKIPKDMSVLEYIQSRSYYPDMLTSDRVIVATDLDNKASFGFNVMAAIILESVLRGETEREIVERIVSQFDHEPEQVAIDYGVILKKMIMHGIIKEEDKNEA